MFLNYKQGSTIPQKYWSVSVGALNPIKLGMLYIDNCNYIFY